MSPKITYDTASNYHGGISDEMIDVVETILEKSEEHGFLLKGITLNTDVRSPPNFSLDGEKVGVRND